MFAGMIGAAITKRDKPKVPEAPSVDVTKQAKLSYEDIATSLPKLQDIAAQINAFTTQNLLAQQRTILPGIGKARRQAMANTSALLKGQIPTDVLNNLKRSAASAALKSGTAGSAFGYNFTPESVGLTSLQLQQQGLGNLESMAQVFRAPEAFNYSSLFVTPAMRAENQWRNEQSRFQTDWMRNQLKSMPTQLEQEFMNFSHQFDKLAWSAAGTAAGGGIGSMFGNGSGANTSYSSSYPPWSTALEDSYLSGPKLPS